MDTILSNRIFYASIIHSHVSDVNEITIHHDRYKCYTMTDIINIVITLSPDALQNINSFHVYVMRAFITS